MPFEFTFSGGDGEEMRRSFDSALQLQPEDIRYALERQKERILSRTAKGLDSDEVVFAPYSENGPYYYYPTPGHKRSAQGRLSFVVEQERRSRSRSAANMMRRPGLSGRGSQKVFSFASGKVHRAQGSAGIRFESYGAFKRALGRSCVDLLGPTAPHMLQAIQVLDVSREGGTIGIYGNEAGRAEGHNLGNAARELPQRLFFDISENDADLIVGDIDQMLGRRLGNF